MSQVKLFGGKSRRAAASQSPAPKERPKKEKQKKQRSPLKIITVILSILAVLECGYFVCVYSDIPFIAKWREIYIQTAMDTMRHRWLATAFIPQGVIEEAMASRADALQEQTEHSSSDSWAGNQPSTDSSTTTETSNTEEDAFYELFWEIDKNSMEAYLKQHPETLDKGWDEIYINEAGLDDDGTSIQTTQGEQVLAIDVPNQILLVRVKGSGYRGVLAVAKDPSRLCVENSAGLGSYGQYVGTIASNHNGVLAMNGSGFLDPGGVGNGGLLTGFSMSNGEATQGAPFGWGYKRIELREDNYFYIMDTSASVHEDTTDAVEFSPAVIVDGNVLDTSGWAGLHPRTIIGQSDKGEILMLVIEGRLVQSVGISVADCAPILLDHNCMQALALDGGTSSILWYDGEYVTQCSNTALPEGRLLPNAFVYKAK